MGFHQRKTGTKTSAFGSPGRISHDSTPFYTSRLYEGLPKEQIIKYAENPIPPEFLDKIFPSFVFKLIVLDLESHNADGF